MRKFFWGVLLSCNCWAQIATKTPEAMNTELSGDLRGINATNPLLLRPGPLLMPAPFDLPPSGTRQTAAGQTISVRQLQHKIPKGVDRAFQHALKLSRAGKHVSAADDLETVVQREPEFSRAVNQLGIEYAFLGRWEDAEAAFRRVLALEPSSWNAHYNLALILFGRGDLDGAEQSTRRALLFSSQDVRAHLLLGELLIMRDDTMAEGVTELKIAARSMVEARRVLQTIGGREP